MGSGYDAWYPGYIDYAPVFKNIPAFWTETQGRGAAPTETRREQIAADMQRPQSLYSSPWLGGTWTLRDQVEYMKTASIATLEYAAKYKDSLLYGRYLAGKAQIAKGRREAPYAYVVPQAQRDPVAAVEMLRRLAFAGVRVSRLTSDETIEGERFPEGTWIVPADQEFAALAREVLDVQKYPEIRESPGGPLDQPYDAAGWTLPLSMGVRTVYVQAPLSEDVRRRMKLVAEPAGEKIKPSPYTSARDSDAAAVRHRARHRLRFRADGESDRAAGRAHRRIRAGPRGESGGEQRLQGDQPRVEGRRHACGSSAAAT